MARTYASQAHRLPQPPDDVLYPWIDREVLGKVTLVEEVGTTEMKITRALEEEDDYDLVAPAEEERVCSDRV
ncbi:MAG: hypothetical protein Q8765_02425 [Sweet potato little leaf phytoplasma]|nr:hypothetical protein [Sweet potato little leaf phytoplasma]